MLKSLEIASDGCLSFGNSLSLAVRGLLATGGIVAPSVTGGAFYAEPDRKLEKLIRELELEVLLVKEQITDHIKAVEPKKRFSVKVAESLNRHDTDLLLDELEDLQAQIRKAKVQLRAVMQEEDDMEVLLLLQ